ncbi:Translation machinery-associated protein 46 [Maublancomyces gigas]|uniref:Translation machinery-associated protein 46 n=1 Tax=Discina gigas TaxID=1032678 RepID=A0ABR3GQZ8_9PEZI
MPPKGKDTKGGMKPSVQKTVQDKTFGLKNKKGGKAQKAIAQLQSQVSAGGTPEEKRKAADKAKREAEKIAAEQAKKEVADLFKPVQVQKVPFGVDPKSVVCVYYKNGHCEKGKKCKFSHDLSIERKAMKKNLYEDGRDEETEEQKKKEETMEEWDEEKLRSVVMSKHGNPKTTTDRVCKFFIDAVENGKYGWFWQCPNGGDQCKYKHSLPPGFVLKTKEQRAAEKALMDKSPLATLTLEEFLEARRAEITGALTPVTEETFKKWKAERMSKKEAEEEARRAKEATGRALFEKGDWQNESDSEDEDEGNDDAGFDLDALRKETQALENEGDAPVKVYGG